MTLFTSFLRDGIENDLVEGYIINTVIKLHTSYN